MQPWRYTLKLHIGLIFLLVVLASCVAIAGIGLTRSSQILTNATDDLFQRISKETIADVQNAFQPGENAVALMAHHPVTDAKTLDERLEHLDTFKQALGLSPNLASLFVGYDNGDFFMFRRLPDSPEARTALRAPDGAKYSVQSIEHPAQGPAIGTFLYFAADLSEIKRDDRPDYVSFDPRKRPWYEMANVSLFQIKTPPYVFFSFADIGTTLAWSSSNGRAVIGADITLQALSEELAKQKITPGSQLALFDDQGKAIAFNDFSKLLKPEADGKLAQSSLDQLDQPVMNAIAARYAQQEQRTTLLSGGAFDLDAGGESWRALVTDLPIKGGTSYHLAIAVPQDEMLADARKVRREFILTTLAVILAVIPLTLLVVSRISKPIRTLWHEAEAIRRFNFADREVTHSMVAEVADLAQAMDGMKGTIRRFLDISLRVASEPNFQKLLPELLDETLQAARARAGVLYLPDEEQTRLEPVACRMAGMIDGPQGLPSLALDHPAIAAILAEGRSQGGPIPAALAGADALGRLLANTPNATAKIAVPLLVRERGLVGVMVLLCEQTPDSSLVAFVQALSGSMAVTLEARDLIQAQKRLFNSFVKLLAGAIDAKSAYTGGHCARVPELTRLLAEAAAQSQAAKFKDFQMSDDDWEALHIAGWLHDCGKITTPEFVVDKATKLETIYDRIHEVRTRFEVLWRDAEVAYWQGRAEGGDPAQLEEALKAEQARLTEDYGFVATCNEGGEFMADDKIARLKDIASRRWLRHFDDSIGIGEEEKARKPANDAPAQLPVWEDLLADKAEHLLARPANQIIPDDNRWGFRMSVPQYLYNRGELYNLTVKRGTLTEEDRYKINEHIVQTMVMLSELPFPKHLRDVPEIAGSHHEKMDGTGYPRRLAGDEINLLGRIMVVADIFEALTAVDRPYKKGKTLSEAVKIMSFMVKDHHLDRDLFELFLSSGAYRVYAEKFMRPEQIDDVEVETYLSAPVKIA